MFYSFGVKSFLHPCNWKVNNSMKNRIKEFRESGNISQGRLAELCKVSRQTINAIENNKYDPSLQLAFDLARNLGVTIDELFQPYSEE
jgi:putative transcriptional regulator